MVEEPTPSLKHFEIFLTYPVFSPLTMMIILANLIFFKVWISAHLIQNVKKEIQTQLFHVWG